jgi:hypothetical protein
VAFLGLGAPSAGAIDTCPNVVFRTGPSAKLPECRAYELVTPTYTGSQPPTAIGFGGDLPGMFATDNVTPGGDSVVYNTVGGALSGFSGTGYVDRYRARRSSQGWVTEPISPGGDEMILGGPGGISSDHEYAVGGAAGATEKLWPAFGGAGLQYLRTPEGYEPLARGSLGDAVGIYENKADWITPGATHVIFTSRTKLEPNAPESGTQAVYDRTPGGPTHVVSLLPDGKAVSGANFLGATKDGTEVAFTPGGHEETPGNSPFYVRRNNAVTEEVVRPDGLVPGKPLKCSGEPASATLEYQWMRNGTEIGGATSSTYTTATADAGSVVQCQVKVSNSQGTSVRTSTTRLVEPYQGKIFPTIRGNYGAYVTPSASSTEVGTLLTCTHPDISNEGLSFEYRWVSDGNTEIGGATASTYTPVEADAGHSIQCRVSAGTSNGTALAYSSPIAVTKVAPRASVNPAISNLTDPGNTPQSGDELSCSQGTWSASPTFAYQWLRDGEEIAGAGSSTYTVEAGDDGKSLQCRVTATSGGVSTEAVSKQVYFTTATEETHPFLETFGSASQPSFSVPTSIAVNQSNGDLLVVDPEAATLSRFKPDGTPDDFSALGTNVISETSEGPLSFPTAAARRRSSVQVAVDNSGGPTQGNIYLATGTQEESRIDIFSSTGAFLGKLDQYKEGASASGSLTPFAERACGVAVAPDGTVYAGDSGGYVHKYVPSGSFPTPADNTANFSYPEACALAAGVGPTAGFLFVDSYGGGEGELSKLDSSSGEIKYTVAVGVTTVSVDPASGHVYAIKGSELKELDSSGASSASTVSQTGIGTGQGAAIRGSNTHVFVSSEGNAHISVYGPTAPSTPEPSEQLAAGEVFGSAQVGNSLFCATGTWSGSPSFTRQWLRNGDEIAGGTGGSYTLTAADLGAVVQCRIAATNANGSTVAINAAEAKIVAPAAPQANASLPQSTLIFDGIFNGRVFYSDGRPFDGAYYYSNPGNLYMYDLNTKKTTAIASTGDGSIVNVSEDGSHVYFVAESALTGSAQNQSGETAFAPAKGTGTLTSGSMSVTGLSTSEGTFRPRMGIRGEGIPAGTTITAVGGGTLTLSKEATASGTVSLGASLANLYIWSAEGDNTKFIAGLSEEDVRGNGLNQEPGLTTWPLAIFEADRTRGRAMDHSRTTADGKVFAFETTAQLTAFDNTEASAADCGVTELGFPPVAGEHCDEVYRYDAESEELTCVSCGPGAGPATGNARLQTINVGQGFEEVGPASINSPVESLTADGDMVFFESTEGLLPQDGNGTKDVYRWKKGSGLVLISNAEGSAESALYGVTPSGSDAVFGTREKLLPEDENGSTTRLYDARVNGGFPPPEETVTEPCAGDACQGRAAAAPEPPNVASSSLNGEGNVAQKANCGRHSRRVVRNGSERCVRKKHHKHRRAHHKRRAAQ